MAIPSRVHGAGTYFVTSVTWERRRIFQIEANAKLFISKLDEYRKRFLLHAYVVMPDHMHLLITPRDMSLERIVQFIKGGFSHAFASKSPVWQRGFSDVRVRDAADAAARIRYIEQNPLGAHLARELWEYPFSSAYPDRLRLDILPSHLLTSPQGLKPPPETGPYGTAEAVPFQGLSKTCRPAHGPVSLQTQEPARKASLQGRPGSLKAKAVGVQELGTIQSKAVLSLKVASSEHDTHPDLSDYATWLERGHP